MSALSVYSPTIIVASKYLDPMAIGAIEMQIYSLT